MDPKAPSEDRWRDVVDFERDCWKAPVPKEAAIRERFGVSTARYYQLLNAAIDLPEALEYDPMLVRRLRRVREARRHGRVARRLERE